MGVPYRQPRSKIFRGQLKMSISTDNGNSGKLIETLRLRFSGSSRKLQTSRTHVTSTLPSDLRFEVRARSRGK